MYIVGHLWREGGEDPVANWVAINHHILIWNIERYISHTRLYETVYDSLFFFIREKNVYWSLWPIKYIIMPVGTYVQCIVVNRADRLWRFTLV